MPIANPLPSPWVGVPLWAPRINWASPLARGLQYWYSAALSRDIALGALPGDPFGAPTNTQSMTTRPSTRGTLRVYSGTNGFKFPGALGSFTVGTVFAVARLSLDSTDETIAGWQTPTGNSLLRLEQGPTNDIRFQTRDAANNALNLVSSVTPAANSVYYMAGALDASGAGNQWIAVNGIVDNGSPGFSTTVNTQDLVTGYLDRGSFEQPFTGDIGDCGWWNRVLTVPELVALTTNPGQLFLPDERDLWVMPSPAAIQSLALLGQACL